MQVTKTSRILGMGVPDFIRRRSEMRVRVAARLQSPQVRPMLSIGTPAPAFSAVNQRGETLALDDLLKNGPLVLYFYPKDYTSVCTAEACMFRDSHADFAELNATIVGVSGDGEEKHAKFAKSYGLNFSLLADRDRKIHKAYKAMGFLNLMGLRITYVIDQKGIIRGAYSALLQAEAHIVQAKRTLAELNSAHS